MKNLLPLFVIGLIILGNLIFWLAVVFVAIHFILKLW